MPIYQCGESNPCGWQIELSEDNAELKQRIAQLEAQNARMESRLREWDKFIARCHDIIGEEPNGAHTLDQRIAALKAERDALRGAVAAQDERDVKAGERVGLPFGCDASDWMADEIIALRADRDRDRARYAESEQEINRHVRHLTAERDAYRSQFWEKALPELTEMRKQRDAARAWAAAWKRAATYERATTMWPPSVKHSTQTYRRYGSVARRADRADRAGRRAAEAMERR